MWERRARRQDVFWIAAGLALALGCGESSEPVDTVTATAREGAQPVRPRVRATAPVQRDTRPLEIRRKEIEEIPFVETDEAKALAKLKPQLADPEIEVREAVVMALGAIETEEATDLLAA